ncbi:MAG: branched-chain amino acid ABC transporter permease [Thermoplasmata archaeon]|nr:MAG: branched-chain amino acid ABC transporter permease [Thermoplasmata archaeon]
MVIDPIYGEALVYASLLTLLSLGLTLTFLTTKVPNFAHGTFATVGMYVTLTLNRLYGVSPYVCAAPAALMGGVVALAQYIFVLRPLTKRGASIITLMVATIAFEFILLALLNIYADYLIEVFRVKSRYFRLSGEEVVVAGVKGLLITAPALVVGLAVALHLLLTKTRFGIAMRAAIENPSLAGALGVNVDLVYQVSWLLAGALAGLAGGLMPLRFLGNPDRGSMMLVSIFAASVAGGFYNIYGGFVGGYVIGLAEILGTNALSKAFGAWVMSYRLVIPLVAMTITLLALPTGLTGLVSKLRRPSGSAMLKRWLRWR